jgi:tetratricopeptide (TPR) repeat protein
LKRYDEAKIALQKALKINPIDTDVLFELGEVSKHYKNWKELFQLTKDAHKVSYTKEDLARCYRNFGYYFIEQGKFDDAIAMYYASLFFDRKKAEKAMSELNYIKKITKKQIVQPDEEQRLAVFKKNNIKFGVDENLFNLIYDLGQVLEKKKEYDKAKYCYKVLFGLTGDEKFKELIDNIPE